jgi:hypothetical protein
MIAFIFVFWYVGKNFVIFEKIMSPTFPEKFFRCVFFQKVPLDPPPPQLFYASYAPVQCGALEHAQAKYTI